MNATIRNAPFPFWRLAALEAYYGATLPYRILRNRQREVAGQSPAMVLFYHRVADHYRNGWTISNRTFARQIDWLQRHFDLVSLSETQRRLASGYNHRACVSITFDDGYADNCQEALPLLIRLGIPCTYFITTHHVLHGRPFSHDLARGVPLEPNTPQQIRELAQAGIEIGVHTQNHVDLAQVHDPTELYEEIVGARLELEALTGQPARYFAFPYGRHENLTTEAFQLAREGGYEGVCSAYGGYNFPGDDPFHLQRIHADDDLIRFKNWLTVDPRKLKQIQRFVPSAVEEHSDAIGVCS